MTSGAIGGNSPPEIEDLFRFLTMAGFVKRSDRRGGMGGVLVILEGPAPGAEGPHTAWVEMLGDRGTWSVRLRMAGMSEFIHLMAWQAKLDGTPIREMNIAEQVEFVKARLQDVATAVRNDPAIETALVQLGSQFMRQKYPWINKFR